MIDYYGIDILRDSVGNSSFPFKAPKLHVLEGPEDLHENPDERVGLRQGL
jgi:hypothetical protein